MLGFKPKRTNLHEKYDYPRETDTGRDAALAHLAQLRQRIVEKTR